ncbi:hypothetical protein [Paenirhodobacter populi]|nr:hypothetical protein [Sinirhodobacter populi]
MTRRGDTSGATGIWSVPERPKRAIHGAIGAGEDWRSRVLPRRQD